jgi:hypothetical protein
MERGEAWLCGDGGRQLSGGRLSILVADFGHRSGMEMHQQERLMSRYRRIGAGLSIRRCVDGRASYSRFIS